MFRSKPRRAAEDCMDRTKHKITACTSCRHKGTDCKPGLELIKQLRVALDAVSGALPSDFEISGIAYMMGCDRPCAVAYHATAKATYLFGDIAPEANIPDLVAFADQYCALDGGLCSSTNRPGKLRKYTLAGVPAALIVSNAETLQ